MKTIKKFAVVNILQNAVVDNHFTYFDYFANTGKGIPSKRWEYAENAIKIAEMMYEKHLSEKGVYHNWAVLEQTYSPRKTIPDKLLRNKIIFVANPNFEF